MQIDKSEVTASLFIDVMVLYRKHSLQVLKQMAHKGADKSPVHKNCLPSYIHIDSDQNKESIIKSHSP